MTRDEAWKIIDRWSCWNIGQKSTDHAFGGSRTVEDDIYDSRRALLAEAYRTLESKSVVSFPVDHSLGDER